MTEPFICNAIIEKADITIERGFILTAMVHLDFGGSGQGFGGYTLGGTGDAKCADHTGPNYAAEFIAKCMSVAGVERWDQMRGKTVRVRKDTEWGQITAIGHIVKDQWFYPKAAFAALRARVSA